MSESETGLNSGTSQIIAVLRTRPSWLDSFKKRLETFSYVIMDFKSPEYEALNLVHPPRVAVIPFSYRVSLDAIQEAMTQFQERYPDATTTYLGVYTGRLPYRINDLYRIGLSGFFQAPLEDEIFLNKVCELAPVSQSHKDMTLDQLVRINILDIETTEQLPYDVFLYLPVNKKTILYLEKSSKLDEKTVRKFQENRHYNLYIRRSDLKAYQSYSGRKLSQFGDGQQMTATEKSKKVAERIGGLMGGFFSDEEYSEDDSRQMVENLKAFVEDLEDAGGSKKEAMSNVEDFAAQKLTSASHAQNVAAYCAYFGMTLGMTEPQTLRMGGLLHDIGKSEIPVELIGKDVQDMTTEELAKFQLHSGAGKTALTRKKVEVPKEVMDMILYHHEHTDGTGYPFGKKGDEIPPYAKVCAFADEFDKLTSIRPGYPQLSPKEAVMRIAGLDGQPALPIYDPVFHRPLVDTFLKEGFKHQPATDAGAQSGSIKIQGEGSGAKAPAVTLGRLLKTDQFKKPDYLPDLRSQDPRLDDSISELSEQLTDLFKRRVAVRESKAE